MSTSPLGSTWIQRGCSRPVANALTSRPGAATGFSPFAHPWAVGILSVGMAPCGLAAGITGVLPQAGAYAGSCTRRHSSATPPTSATMRAKIPERLIQFPCSIAGISLQHPPPVPPCQHLHAEQRDEPGGDENGL